MKVGLIGHPGVGKSTLLAALTGTEVDAGGRDRRAMVELPDPRLDHLRDVFEPRKFTRARFEIEECPPLPGATTAKRGEVIARLRDPDALIVVIGSFEIARAMLDPALHDPAAQLRSVLDELLLLDLEVLEQRTKTLTERRERGAIDKMDADRQATALARLTEAVEAGERIEVDGDEEAAGLVAELKLFGAKPKIAVVNVGEGEEADLALPSDGSVTHVEVVTAPIEHEIALMDDEEDRAEFLASYGLAAPASERISRLAFDALDLITFFTVGDDEVKAWPVRRGSDAVTAAGKIHSDLARGFIRAEVTPYERVTAAANAADFKTQGAADVRGKDHVVEDGDTLNIRFSV